MIEDRILSDILSYGPAFLLVAARALALLETAPLVSSDVVPQTAKLALAGFAAFTTFPTIPAASWRFDPFTLNFLLLIIGEGIIGVILGFYLTLIFSAFSTAGQFFSLQMGFGASETFDPLNQVENPLMGQYLNLVAMLVFLSLGGFEELFLGGFWRSLQSINIVSLTEGREQTLSMLLSGLSRLFMDAIVISLPILGTLFLTSLSTGLISKAAPQINILSEGFPISIIVAFMLILMTMPFMVEAFSRVVGSAFQSMESLYAQIGTKIEGGNL